MERSTRRKANMGKELRNRRRIGVGLNPGGACCLIVSITLSGSGAPADSNKLRASAVRSPTAADCTGLKVVVLPSGRVTCTPGTDPAPEGIDPTVPRPLVGTAQAQ